MRLIAWILVIVGLVLAIVSAVPAYSPKTTLTDDRFVTRDRDGVERPLTLGAATGVQVIDGQRQPLARSGDSLTPELLSQLRATDQKRVRVKEFSFARWSEWWVFVLGCAGMLTGAMLIRRENARQFVSGAAVAAKPGQDADTSLRMLREELSKLRRNVLAQTDRASQLQLIIERADRIIADHVPPFIDARPTLAGRLGLAGYAQLMDHFAAGERKLNRAWSAAADGYIDEAVENLDLAAELFDQADQRLKR